MTYVQPNSSSSRASTLIGVGALHVVAIYGIVSAFGFELLPRPAPPPIAATHIPTQNIPDPLPTPSQSPTERVHITPFDLPRLPPTPPIPPIGGTIPQPPIGTGTGSGTIGGDDGRGLGGIGTVVFPTPSATPTPPLFTAKGPRVRGDQARWVPQSEYPTRAINLGLQGITRVRLSVAASGRVTGCEVAASSGSPLLDSAACDALMRRARFDPATDTAGDATSGTFSTSVRWQLPER